MKRNPICTSLKQAQLLISKGLPEETADMYYMLRPNQDPQIALLPFKQPYDKNITIPAWSLSALINQLNEYIGLGNMDFCLAMLTKRIVYWNSNEGNPLEYTDTNLLDTVVDILIWHIDNNQK